MTRLRGLRALTPLRAKKMPPGALCSASFNQVGKEVRLNGTPFLHVWLLAQALQPCLIGNLMLLKLHAVNQALAGWRHCSVSMIGMGENQLGAQAVRASLLDAETRFTIGRWNVQTMFDTSRTMQVIQEIRNYKLSLYISSGSVNAA